MQEGEKNSFTLIELLVVVAIIGLLASIALVNLSRARRQARIASGMQFSDSLRAGLNPSMISWWRLDNTANDSWNGNDGTIYGALWTEGIVKRALRFDGEDDYVDISGTASLNFEGKNTVTVEAWVKRMDRGSGCCPPIVAQRDIGSWALRWDSRNTGSELEFIIGPEGWAGDDSSFGIALPSDEWNHVAGTYDGSKIILYLNGKEVDKLGGLGGGTFGPGTETEIGGATDGNFEGIIDEVRIYGRPLTAFEIQKKYLQDLKFKLVEK